MEAKALRDLYEAIYRHPLAPQHINWEAFDREAQKVGLKLTPFGLLPTTEWDVLRPLMKEAEASADG